MIDGVVTYRAVFFDAGETLVHPHPSFPELLGLVLRDEGFDVDPSTIRDGLYIVSDQFRRAARDGELWTTSAKRSRQFWITVYGVFLERLGLHPDPALISRLYAEFSDLSNYRAFPDVLPALERLHAAGLVLGVISNFEEWLERLLESLGLARFFDVRVISGVEGVEKPDPRIFQLALDRTGIEASDAVYVGDIPDFDIDPARSVGMDGVLIDRRGRYPNHAGTRITTLEDLPRAIGLAPVAV
jgi:putative hydrolase of the HAD superfamily